MACGIQHGASALGAGLPATGTASHPSKTGAWRCGKQNPFPTSPHPRLRLRTKVKRGVTLTFHLVQKIGPVSETEASSLSSRQRLALFEGIFTGNDQHRVVYVYLEYFQKCKTRIIVYRWLEPANARHQIAWI